MPHFLGSFGIDVKLLIAQIINFGILLFVLSKLVYKPIIRRIERDEQALDKAEKENERLDKAKNRFEEHKKKEICATKKRVREILREAEDIAKEIQKRARSASQKERRNLRAQSVAQIEVKGQAQLQEISQQLRKESLKNIESVMRRIGSDTETKRVLGDFFLSQLLDSIPKLPVVKTKRKPLDVLFEYALPLTKEKYSILLDIITKHFGATTKVSKKVNKQLISGYRLEISGHVIENNLLYELSQAFTNIK